MRTRLPRTVAVGVGAVLLSLSLGAGASAAIRPGRALSSRARQIAVLDAAYAHMKADYAHLDKTAEIAPADILGYGIQTLWKQGVDGAGTTVALLEGWRDPGIGAFITSFDRQYQLPPAQISTIYPSGPLPPTCPQQMQRLGDYGSCFFWRYELRLDVASVHLIAPYAKILLAVTPADAAHADDAEGVAPAQMMAAVQDIAAKHLANVISSSDGSGESTYSHGIPEITAQDPGELAAAAAGIPFVNASGDCGAAQDLAEVQNYNCQHVTHFASSGTWADSPWVTAVGGSIPNLNPRTGARRGGDHLWYVYDKSERFYASAGAGLSAVFARPSYQNAVASITHSDQRSIPDITMDSSDGTSQAAPLFAGVLALATQENGGQDIGPINPSLYAIGPRGRRAGIADVIGNNNAFRDPITGQILTKGYTATRGFDIASGWGTINAPRFVPALVAETKALGEESAERGEAAADLTALQATTLKVTATPGVSGDELTVTASGLLPEYPVSLSVDGQVITTHLKANGKGDLAATVPAAPLAAGAHTASLSSLLITETASFSAPV